MRTGSAPNFCPPIEEGIVLGFEDERGETLEMEFLGIIIHNERHYGFFIEEEGASGELVILEVIEEDEEGIPLSFELVEDEAIAAEVYADFAEATKDLYDFE